MSAGRPPITLDGWHVLHQMFRFRWEAWRALPSSERAEIAEDAATLLTSFETGSEGSSAVFNLMGHKGDLMLVHFRSDFDRLAALELALSKSPIGAYLTPTTSYLSIVELGLYAATLETLAEMKTAGVDPDGEAGQARFAAVEAEQAAAMRGRLFSKIPNTRYLCFYPMDKKRGEAVNWYREEMHSRGTMMREHGMIGRKYAGKIQQIISGSIGFDDFEWGVDLFAQDPSQFKKLIYEMRFDRASADFALFGPFYLGLRFAAKDMPRWLDGELPAMENV